MKNGKRENACKQVTWQQHEQGSRTLIVKTGKGGLIIK